MGQLKLFLRETNKIVENFKHSIFVNKKLAEDEYIGIQNTVGKFISTDGITSFKIITTIKIGFGPENILISTHTDIDTCLIRMSRQLEEFLR